MAAPFNHLWIKVVSQSIGPSPIFLSENVTPSSLAATK
jgi:hypothetical protein